MRKLWFSLTMIVVLLLTACGQAAATPPQTSSTKAAPAAAASTARKEPAACTVASRKPTGGPTEPSLFPVPTEQDWKIGPDDAKVTIIEYTDYQCPYCAKVAPVLVQLTDKYPQDVRIIFRHFPLYDFEKKQGHDKEPQAAAAAEAAGKQGKFFEFHERLFAKQNDWVAFTTDQFDTWLVDQAKSFALDVDQFNKDRNSEEILNKLKEARKEADRLQLPGTPFFLIDGRIYDGPTSFSNFSAIIELFKMEDRQFTECPPMEIDPAKQYVATLKTEKGDIVIQLYADKAPTTVNSFVFLARKGWFDNVMFHRVIPGFVAQGGDPSGSGMGGPGYAFGDEIDPTLKFDREGLLGMANAGPNTNGSQFFITFAPLEQLDGKYTIFGEVIKGLDVAKTLTARDPSKEGELPMGDKILSVSIEEK